VHHPVVPSIDEKQPSYVSPEKVDPWGMRVGLVVAVLMMHAMDGDPSRRGILQCADAANRDAVFKPFWAFEPPVSQKPMVPDRYA
jgi:hypothetical protein